MPEGFSIVDLRWSMVNMIFRRISKFGIENRKFFHALLESYNGKKKNQVWLTLELWQAAGYSVRKGETAQMIWGKKQESTNKETGETYSYFQILFVFNNTQVERSSRNFKENPVLEPSMPGITVDSINHDLPF